MCDGLKGLAQALTRYKVQYYQFHQVKTADEYLTKNPQTDADKELQKIAHLLCHTDKEYFIGMLDMWYDKWGEWLKHRTLDRKIGKKLYTHQRVRSAYFSMKRHMKWLWTWYDYPDTPIPNTNNILMFVASGLQIRTQKKGYHCYDNPHFQHFTLFPGWKMGLLPSPINPFSINLTPHFRVTQFFGISIGNKDTKNKSIRNKSL